MSSCCVHKTADVFLIILFQAGYSRIQLSSLYSIGGYVLDRLREEMADSTLLERKLAPKILSHTFTDEDKERQKQKILTWNPQLMDRFIIVKRDFLPTRDETWEDYKKIMEASGFRAMSYSGFTQYVHFF